MLNTLKLDWLGMKYYWIRILMLPFAICFMGLFSETLIIPSAAFMMLSFSVNPFAVEEKGKLDNLYLTLPITRKTIVNARFGLSLIMQLGGLAFGTAATVLLSALLFGRTIGLTHTFQADFDSVFLIICGSLLFYAVMNLSMFPILFKMGYAKGKALGFYIPVFSSVLIVYAAFIIVEYNASIRDFVFTALQWSLSNTVWVAFIMLAAALLLVLSYFLSQKAYAKREF